MPTPLSPWERSMMQTFAVSRTACLWYLTVTFTRTSVVSDELVIFRWPADSAPLESKSKVFEGTGNLKEVEAEYGKPIGFCASDQVVTQLSVTTSLGMGYS